MPSLFFGSVVDFERARHAWKSQYLTCLIPYHAMPDPGPLPWQLKAWNDRAPILLASGSAGGGKSLFAARKLNYYLLRYPGAFGLIVRKTRESMSAGTALMMESEVLDPKQSEHVASRSRFLYRNGSMAVYLGMSTTAERQRIRSIGRTGGVDFCWIEEAVELQRDDFEALRARMRGSAAPWRQMVLTTNPDAPEHWINADLIVGGGASVHYSGAADNPYVDDQYRETLASLTGVNRLRLAEGKWVRAEGIVHNNWDPAVNLVDRFDLDPGWRRIGAIDVGWESPTVAQWWAIDDDGRMILYREIYRTHLALEECVDMIVELQGDENVDWYIDYAGGNRSPRIGTQAANKDVMPGLQAVNARLRVAGDGRPRMMLFHDALCHPEDERLIEARLPTRTAGEFAGYVWQRRATDGAVLDQPVKANDHGMDAARYAAMAADVPELMVW